MRIAVFSDVQGNLPAMEAAVDHIRAWRPDMVVMNGDLVNRGPRSADCLRLFDESRGAEGWLPLRGNHEDYVLHCSAHPPDSAVDAAMRRFTDWTVEQLGERMHRLGDWPDHLCLSGAANAWIHVTHGSLAGNRDGISRSVPDAELRGKVPEDVDLFVVAHTHKPLDRVFSGVRIINVGSVGSPFDGDIRSSYARIERHNSGWRAEIVRLPYDRTQAERDFRQSGFLEHGGPLAEFIFEEWRRARLMMPQFKQRYFGPVLRGELALDRAVRDFLAELR